jgi:hypothetical protein
MELKISWTEFLHKYRIKEIKEKSYKKTQDEIYYLFYKMNYEEKTTQQIKKEASDRAIKKEQKRLEALERRKADARVRSLARYHAKKDEINKKRREINKLKKRL